MAANRETILRTAPVVFLRTAPVDPYDAFRGDYVRLDYEISRVPTHLLRDGLRTFMYADEPGSRREHKVYASLEMKGDLGTLTGLSDREPGDGRFIRGRARPGWGRTLHVQYGIEAFFVEQGKGLELERRRIQDGVQIPLEMAVAVSANGTAVLKDYRWSDLGIGLDLTFRPQVVTNTPMNRVMTNRVVDTATVTLLNASTQDLAVVDLPGAASLSLEQDLSRDWAPQTWTWVGRTGTPPTPTDAHVRLLKPGEKHTISIAFANPAWFVSTKDGTPQPVTGLPPWESRFRLVYRSPSPDACRALQAGNRIWQGELRSRAFNGSGGMD
jgi:uncharacterized membrane-anchored protein